MQSEEEAAALAGRGYTALLHPLGPCLRHLAPDAALVEATRRPHRRTEACFADAYVASSVFMLLCRC